MKKIIGILVLMVSVTVTAQSKYEKGMQKAFSLWQANKITEASQLFERITNAEKQNWLPAYYVATIEITSSFGVKEEAVLDAKLKKAQTFLDFL